MSVGNELVGAFRLQRLVALFYAICEIIQLMKRYEMICKRRDLHRPMDGDVKKFTASGKSTMNTVCDDCGSALQLSLDDDDPDILWVTEI